VRDGFGGKADHAGFGDLDIAEATRTDSIGTCSKPVDWKGIAVEVPATEDAAHETLCWSRPAR
jgi:hypothetical protein